MHADKSVEIGDSGINEETRQQVVDAGATMLVAGNYILKSADYRKAIHMLKSGAWFSISTSPPVQSTTINAPSKPYPYTD